MPAGRPPGGARGFRRSMAGPVVLERKAGLVTVLVGAGRFLVITHPPAPPGLPLPNPANDPGKSGPPATKPDSGECGALLLPFLVCIP